MKLPDLVRHFFIVLFILVINITEAQTTFVSTGSVWRYSSGTDLGTAWRDVSYNDSSWSQGASQLGFGDGDEATVIPGGPSGNRYPTHYFRHKVNITNPNSFQAFTLKVKRDDGIVVYVNGAEVFRDNISGTPTYNSWASASISDDGNTWLTGILAPASFTNGINTIAAEVHQINATSSDLSFDLELTGGTPPAVSITRGPYLQLTTPSSIYLRWKTDIATATKVSFGTLPISLNQNKEDLCSTTEHIVQLTGLLSDTKYFYSVGHGNNTLQGDSNNFFITPPLVGTEKTTRIWATGDCGTAQTVQTNVMNAYANFIGSKYTNVWLLLGDNAYESGTDNEYHTKFFQPYMNGKVMRQTALFPAPGNHDYYNTSDLNNTTMPYFQIFTLPANAEAGGVPSATEKYYSFDYANIHFISLDSYGTENGKKLFDTTSAQISWLKQDLENNSQTWTIIYWHHPPYTKGSHNSDTESELVNIRDKVLRILDRYKVDLILCGHSHNYERSKLMKGHYGLENTFDPSLHNAGTSSGLYNGSPNSCPYIKSSTKEENEGIVYVVAGSAGKLGTTSTGYPHNAMYYSNSLQGGSLYLEVTGNRLDAKWIAEDGSVLDQFTIMKDVNTSTNASMVLGDSIQFSASWRGVYEWTPGGLSTKTITASPASSTTYYVTDSSYNCLHDTFNVKVNALISGFVRTEIDTPVSGVTIVLSGSESDTVTTDDDGFYSIEAEVNGDYVVTPSKVGDTPASNGVSTFDITLVRKQVLVLDSLHSPFKIIAADVNGSAGVSTQDILYIRSLILGNTQTFPVGTLWEFVSSDHVFGNPYYPFPFEKIRSFPGLNASYTNQNFIGIKLGDVNNSWTNTPP